MRSRASSSNRHFEQREMLVVARKSENESKKDV